MKKLIICMVAAGLFAACEKSDSIDNSIWIADPDDSGLPKYTEWGYNTFGAQMGTSYFSSCWRDTPFTMEWHDNDSTLELTMNGCQTYKGRYDWLIKEDMSLTIIIPCDSVIDSFKKLYLLNGKFFNLTNPDIKVLVRRDNNPQEIVSDIRSGNFYFKRVQMLYVDENFEKVIVSGTFDIRYVRDGEKTWLSDGRFDLGVTQNLFW